MRNADELAHAWERMGYFERLACLRVVTAYYGADTGIVARMTRECGASRAAGGTA